MLYWLTLASLDKALEGTDGAANSNTDHGLGLRNSAANGSSSSLTRRRSLVQTPGVATRTSPVEGNRKTWHSWKPPKLSPEEERKWATSHRSSLPIQRLVTHDSAREGPRTPTPRAETPGEMDYSQLGNLKLGSLSIVNGAPSPAPSAKSVNPRARSHVPDDDYFTSTDLGASPLMMKSIRKRGHAKSKSAVLPPTRPLFVDSSNLGSATLSDSIQKHEQTALFMNRQALKEPPQQLSIATNAPDAGAHGAEEYAQVYQAYVPDSPFIQDTTPQNAREGERLRSEEDFPFKNEAPQNFASTIFDAPPTATEAFGSSLFTSPTASSISTKPDGPRPKPRTVDSGYSSGGSVRLSNEEQEKRASPTAYSELCGDTLPEKRPADSHPRRQSAQGPVVRQPVVLGTFHEPQEHNRPPPLDLPDRTVRSSASESLLSPLSSQSITSRASFDSTNSTSQRRLQRKRPSQPDLPVVQSCQSIPEGDIPEVPDNVRSTFVRRLSNTPGMECLTHTYPSASHITTAESVVSGISVAPAAAIAPLAELEPERPPTPPPHGRRRSLSLFRRKSTTGSKGAEKEDENTSLGVVDLGTIASSLGSSPYDAAMSAPQRKAVTSPTHPHQLGGALPRAKSMVGMCSEAAAEYARFHSKDRAIMERELAQQRRKSYHNLKVDAGEVKASKRRPQSGFQNVPPVPMIDTSKLPVPHSAKPRLETVDQSKQKADPSIGTRSRSKGQVISQVVGRFDQCEQEDAQQKVDWDAHARLWSQRRKSLGEGLRAHAGISEATASTVNSRNSVQLADNTTSWGRYSGGLGYNYERGVGVGGSAGTRQSQSFASQKSMQWKDMYGVDLSDVPIMLQRAA